MIIGCLLQVSMVVIEISWKRGACQMHVTGSDGSYGVGSKVNPYYGRNGVQLNLKACKLCATGF